MARYCATKGRWRHGPRIRIHYGYRVFSDPGVAFRLHRFLYALCWTGTDRPSALFDAAATWLLAFKVMLPGLSVLQRDRHSVVQGKNVSVRVDLGVGAILKKKIA